METFTAMPAKPGIMLPAGASRAARRRPARRAGESARCPRRRRRTPRGTPTPTRDSPAREGLGADDLAAAAATPGADSAGGSPSLASAVRRADSVRTRSRTRTCMSRSNSSNPPRPAIFAWYMAASASRRSSAAPDPGEPTAMPTLAVTMCSSPPSTIGSCSARFSCAGDRRDGPLGGQLLAQDRELVAP